MIYWLTNPVDMIDASKMALDNIHEFIALKNFFHSPLSFYIRCNLYLVLLMI